MLIFTVYLHISKFVVKYFAYIVICTVFVVYIRERLVAMPSELKADLGGEFLTTIAEQPNEILKCAMYLFLGYLDGATQYVSFASRSLANVGRRPVRGRRSRKLPTAIRSVMRRRWYLFRPPVGT